ncbi:hypothetical protein [Lactiplantibacillus plantarum]|uniref:hypothetical protein n=1 Tax=Lactiplantibacillus plantarum TaxID=1590 RepID=UPI0037549F2F
MTWSVWQVTPVLTSIFFILGVFTLYVVSVDWLKSQIRLRFPVIKEHLIESWFGRAFYNQVSQILLAN